MSIFLKLKNLFNQKIWILNIILLILIGINFYSKYDDYTSSISNYLLVLHKFFLQFTFWFMLLGILYRKYTPQLLFVNLCLDWFFWSQNIFDVIHFNISTKIFQLTHATAFLSGNPQYTFVLCFLTLFTIIFFKAAFKKTRTFSRVFISLGAGAVLLTFVAFHFTQINYLLNDRKNDEMHLSRYVLLSDDFPKECDLLQYVCGFDHLEDLNLSDVESRKIPIEYKKAVRYANSKKLDRWDLIQFNIDFSLSLTGDDVYVFGIAQRDGHTRFLLDRTRVLRYWQLSETNFSTLGIIAHSFWNGFALFLIFFHQYRFSKRAKITKKP